MEPRKRPLYQVLAGRLEAMEHAREAGNEMWVDVHQLAIDELMKNSAPRGSGFDAGTRLGETSDKDRLVFLTSYHHMNESGYYDGWTDHKVVVLPSLHHGYLMRITGPNRNDIKDYIQQIFQSFLDEEITWDGQS